MEIKRLEIDHRDKITEMVRENERLRLQIEQLKGELEEREMEDRVDAMGLGSLRVDRAVQCDQSDYSSPEDSSPTMSPAISPTLKNQVAGNGKQ